MPNILINNQLFNNLNQNLSLRHLYSLVAYHELHGEPFTLADFEPQAAKAHQLAKNISDGDPANYLAVIQDIRGLERYKEWTGNEERGSHGTLVLLKKPFKRRGRGCKEGYWRDCASTGSDGRIHFIKTNAPLNPKFQVWIDRGVLKDCGDGTSILNTDTYHAYKQDLEKMSDTVSTVGQLDIEALLEEMTLKEDGLAASPPTQNLTPNASTDTVLVPVDLLRKMVQHLASIDAKIGSVLPIATSTPIARPSDLRVGNSHGPKHNAGSATAG